jgi:predicted DNA-binding ribbon-helix-helix protein
MCASHSAFAGVTHERSLMTDQHHHTLKKHSILIAGHRTSLSVETAFWDQLKAIANRRGLSLNKLIEEIDGRRARDAKPSNLSSAIRVFVLDQLLTERTSTPSLPSP